MLKDEAFYERKAKRDMEIKEIVDAALQGVEELLTECEKLLTDNNQIHKTKKDNIDSNRLFRGYSL